MTMTAVNAPGRAAMSEAMRRSMGICSEILLVRTPGQKLPKYQTVASIGALRKAGSVKRHAARQ